MTDILRIENVSITYRHRGRTPVDALRDIRLDLKAGDLRFVHGPSGSGKSTLLLCAGGLLRPDRGKVTLLGHSVYDASVEARSALRARYVGFVFQQFHLIPYLNVLDNVLAPTLAGMDASEGAHSRERAEALIERFGLAHRWDHPPSELSIGERQRVALARALLFNPPLVLADEPTGNLDDANGRRVMQGLADYAQAGAGVLVVSHDPGLERAGAYRLEAGRLKGAINT